MCVRLNPTAPLCNTWSITAGLHMRQQLAATASHVMSCTSSPESVCTKSAAIAAAGSGRRAGSSNAAAVATSARRRPCWASPFSSAQARWLAVVAWMRDCWRWPGRASRKGAAQLAFWIACISETAVCVTSKSHKSNAR